MPNATSDQDQRRRAIRELLGGGPVATQQLLVMELARRGFTATQSSVSRDLREIGAVKTARGYELEPGDVADRPELNAIGEFVRAILPAGPHLIVLRTAIGAAQRVALALDRAGWPEVVGNIGGDDTVFVATDSANHQKILAARLERIVAR
jgi:transcriptional regulator of arginine metabolism